MPERPFIPAHGGYRDLLSYQNAEVIYDITFRFCQRFLEKKDRTIDQMVQAARSGKQNIAEGSRASGTSKEMELKLKDYFKAGVQLVWFIYPKTQTAMIYTSPTSKKELTKDQSLDGGKVLPGFTLPLKKLFAKTRRRLNGKKS